MLACFYLPVLAPERVVVEFFRSLLRYRLSIYFSIGEHLNLMSAPFSNCVTLPRVTKRYIVLPTGMLVPFSAEDSSCRDQSANRS